MSFGKTKLIFCFACFGFVVGSAAYYLFDWILMNTALLSIPFLDIVMAPLFLSGIAGSALSIVVVYAFAHFSKDG